MNKLKSIVDGFKIIARKKFYLLLEEMNLATHNKEKMIWLNAGIDPLNIQENGIWRLVQEWVEQ